MGKKIILLITTLTAIMAFSCKSTPEPVKPEPVIEESRQGQEVFNPASITHEYYASTISEVQQFVEDLNKLISNKNYRAWRAALSPEYFTEISSPQNLRHLSESPAMTTRKIVLRSAEDYFEHVVVPSRANLRVDDIEFINMNRVKAFSITTNRTGEEVRLRLYDLEKINDTWTIIN